MIRWLRKLTSRILRASSASKPAQWFVDWIGGQQETDCGVSLDGKTALKYAPVWNAVNRICGRVAQLPLIVYERTGERTKERAVSHPAYRVLKQRPNMLMGPAVFKELVQYHALMWGNGRAWIERNQRGDPIALVPLLPGQTDTVLVNGDKWHVTRVEVEPGKFETYKFLDANVLHIQGLGYDGICGYPVWQLAKNSWGLGLVAERNQSRLYKHDSVPGLILQAPAGVFPDDEEARKFLQAFRSMHEGPDNAGKTALLREGVEASKLASTPEETQAIEHRKFQRQDAALWFLLESMLGDDSSVSYSSLEQKQLAELINCLNPWLVKWQEQCELKLLRERDRQADSHFIRFNTAALLRSDTKTTYQMLTVAIRGMLITPNEAREIIDREPIDGGDDLLNPAITPGKAGGESGGSDGSDGSNKSDDKLAAVRERLLAAVRDRVQGLVDVERQRIEAARKKPDAMVDWSERFYVRWETTLAEALGHLVPPAAAETRAAELAAAWCTESRRLLALATAVDGWPDRVEQLVGEIVSD